MAGSDDYGYGGLYDRAIRALSGARDWYSDATDRNKPRQIPRGDVNLPVEPPPVEKPWYERIPAPLDIAEQVGRSSIEPVKQAAKQTGGKIAGALGATQESSGRAFGALMDATSTGSEKKPLSDVVWEGLKGVKSGYEAGLGATSASQEFMKRAPEETLSGANPVQRGMLGLGLDAVTDPTNLVPEKYLATGAGALLGAGDAAHGLAWLPPDLFQRARGIGGYTHKANNVSDIKPVLEKGWIPKASDDVLNRYEHAGYYTPKEAKADRASGLAPIATSHGSYSGSPDKQVPLMFGPEVKVLDLYNAPVPREDIDPILASLHPVKDKLLIDRIETAWQKQAKYAEAVPHEKVRSGEIAPEELGQYYKDLNLDPVATKAINELNSILSDPNDYNVNKVYGAGWQPGGDKGSTPLNQPSMTTEFGAIHYPDYNAGEDPSIAFDPRQAWFAPPGTQLDLNKTPWVKGKLAPKGTLHPAGYGASTGTMPADAPGGVSAPLPGEAKLPPISSPIDTTPTQGYTQQQAQDWAAQNIPEEPSAPKSWDVPPTYKGKPISTYEMSTLKEVEARGGPLTKEQTKKLAVIKEYEGGYYTGEVEPPKTVADSVVDHLATELGHGLPDQAYGQQYWSEMEDAEQELFKQKHPELYAKFIEPKITGNPYQGVVEAPAKKTLGAKASDAVKSFIKDAPDVYEDSELVDAWNLLKPADQTFIKNAHPEQYEQVQQAIEAHSLDIMSQGGIEAATQDMSPGQIGTLNPVEAPKVKTLDDIISELEHAGFDYDEAVALAPQILEENAAKSGSVTGPQDTSGLEDVPAPLNPMGKAMISDLDTYGTLDYLKNTYPNVAENFAKHSGTEMGSIEKHTGEVLDQWKTQLTPEDFADISSRYGTDVEALMNVALPLHDIGKPQALAANDKTLQHGFTVPIMSDILKKEGFDQKDIDLATELFNHDMIGSLLQGTSKYTPEQVADQLAKKADKLGMNPSDFAKLQLAFFQADASAYPFVTQFMKQQPNGAWISGSPKVKPIEDLIAGVKSTPGGTAPADTFKLKEANPNLAGMYEKNIYTKGGQDYLFKVADPSKAHMPEMETRANKVAALGGLYDARTAVQTMDGRLGSMQPLIGNRADWPTLRNKDLTKLSSEQLQEIIGHHPVDWLTSNHDAHTGQWLMTSNGIIEIDRGQAWKHFGNDKLSSSYHPNEAFGEEEPIYNQIVELWKDGKLPQLSEADVKSALGTTTSKLTNNRQAVMNNIESALAKFNKSDKIPTAHSRFDTLLQDLEKFWKK